MIILEATEADALRLVEMTTRFLLSTRYGELIKPDPEQIHAFVLRVMELGVVLVAQHRLLVDGQPAFPNTPPTVVGMIGMVLVPHALACEIHADEIAWWVEPEWRGSTLGPKLLRSAEDWATTKRAKVCKMVAPAGTDVGAFYRRVGYVEVETIYAKQL